MRYATRWVRAGIAVGTMSALGWLGGCLDDPGGPVDTTPPPPEGLIVSDPVLAVGAAEGVASGAALASDGDDVAYVSLAPGTVPAGSLATIRRLGDLGWIITTVRDGGFDPIPVFAQTGDSIDVVVSDAAQAIVLQARLVVAARRPPIVVRTDPPRKKTDVPLNAAIVVVFSEPIDPGTLTEGAVQLWRGTMLVVGFLEFRDPAHLTAAFVPTGLLAGATDYTLVITQGVRDLDGEPLEAPVTVDFTTESGSAPVASVTVEPPALTLTPSATLPVTATAFDSAGNPLGGRAVTWSSADAAVATVSAAAMVTGISLGTTTVTATVEGKSATATIEVVMTLVFASVSAGIEHTCGLTTDGTAYCWGYSPYGWLGTGSGVFTTPTRVSGGLTFASLSTGEHTCALTLEGVAYCWGPNWRGELGDGSTTPSTTPVPAAGGLRFVAISVGSTGWQAGHSCGLTAEGSAHCWGDGRFGQLGNGRASYVDSAYYYGSLTPVPVLGGLTFQSVIAGWQHTCGLGIDGTAYCWGAGGPVYHIAYATCLIFDDSDWPWSEVCAPQPTPVSGLTFTALSAGGYWACGLAQGGAGYCWNYYAGSGETGPAAVVGGLSFVALDVGLVQRPTCGVTIAGAAYCWGDLPRSGGQSLDITTPTAVPGGISFAWVSVGGYHACGITPDGTVYCWGDNRLGQLGNGSQDPFSPVPVKVAGQ